VAARTAEVAEPRLDMQAGLETAPARPVALAAVELGAVEFAKPVALAVVEAVVAPAVAVKPAARDSAASRENRQAPEAPGPQRQLLPLLVRRSSGSLFGKAEHPFRIGDISS